MTEKDRFIPRRESLETQLRVWEKEKSLGLTPSSSLLESDYGQSVHEQLREYAARRAFLISVLIWVFYPTIVGVLAFLGSFGGWEGPRIGWSFVASLLCIVLGVFGFGIAIVLTEKAWSNV